MSSRRDFRSRQPNDPDEQYPCDWDGRFAEPATAATVTELREICKRCPVCAECREHAIVAERHLFWGGMTEAERAAERRRRGIKPARTAPPARTKGAADARRRRQTQRAA